ncbi:MAG: hypothetical protein PHI79_01055 [Sulfurovaceae bacterium]|jgi:hypothetical protein|nr:hypothetical protein [Sulfurovaceae bacterium]MDD5548167.1 hypothetical protein [Sulfurovaceae bacterium]
MKFKSVLKKILKNESKNSQVSYKVKELTKSKEFFYLVDIYK